MVALLVKEYLEYYRMEYTLSVFLPEVNLQSHDGLSKEELCKRSGIPEAPPHDS